MPLGLLSPLNFVLNCVQRKLDIAGTVIDMHLLLSWSIKRRFQIPLLTLIRTELSNINFNVGFDNC